MEIRPRRSEKETLPRGIATKSFHRLDNSFAAPATSGARSICIMHVCVYIHASPIAGQRGGVRTANARLEPAGAAREEVFT